MCMCVYVYIYIYVYTDFLLHPFVSSCDAEFTAPTACTAVRPTQLWASEVAGARRPVESAAEEGLP